MNTVADKQVRLGRVNEPIVGVVLNQFDVRA